MPQDPFFEQPFGQYAPTVVSKARMRIFILLFGDGVARVGDNFRWGERASQKSNNKIEQVEIGSTLSAPVFLPSFNLEHGAKPRRYRWMSTGIHGL